MSALLPATAPPTYLSHEELSVFIRADAQRWIGQLSRLRGERAQRYLRRTMSAAEDYLSSICAPNTAYNRAVYRAIIDELFPAGQDQGENP